MLRSTATRLTQRVNKTTCRRLLSDKPNNPLAADSGNIGTHLHHNLSMGLAVLTPLWFLMPDSYSDGFIDKGFGVLLAGSISGHSWIGMNYVATDYVPKVSKALLGPSRVAIAGMTAVTFLGLSRCSIQSEGGIKGCLKGLWNPPPSK
ncbi:unnamed protein product [Pseudo-nitzschia multistriata]|uniref:Succinate dehydrogenase [ubiquinone] cytochrome b small subunit n=1 Tax=Pseudo-nitzschia multistriata TaxID=183589 RepID=A0A448ZRD7_9STRA|nr:unnamed protein product [Pseudo-nitzschia multistriata]